MLVESDCSSRLRVLEIFVTAIAWRTVTRGHRLLKGSLLALGDHYPYQYKLIIAENEFRMTRKAFKHQAFTIYLHLTLGYVLQEGRVDRTGHEGLTSPARGLLHLFDGTAEVNRSMYLESVDRVELGSLAPEIGCT